RAGVHRLLGVGAWLLMTFLMSLMSEIPERARELFPSAEHPGAGQYLYPKLFRIGWVLLTIALLVALVGTFISQFVIFIGIFLLSIITAILSGYLVFKYRIPAQIQEEAQESVA
ncbi:MAG: hypothetical protein P8Y60_09145, partial [Calditrichota bacterium]